MLTKVSYMTYSLKSVNAGTPNEVGHESVMEDVPSSYAHKANLQKLDDDVPNDADYDVWLPLASIHEFVRNNWKNIDSRNHLKEDLSRVPVWVKFHDVHLVAYTSDGLSLTAMKIGTPMTLDSYTNFVCLESWGRSSYARILIEINACNDFSDNLIMFVPHLEGTGYTKETIRDTIVIGASSGADDEGFIEVKKKKSCHNNKGNKNFKPVSMKPKTQYRPKAKQSTEGASQETTPSVGKKNVSTSVEAGNKASTSGVQEEEQRSTPIVERINVFEKHLLEEKCVLVDDDGNMENVDYLGDHGSEDEVEPIENDMASYLASKPSGVGYCTKSLLE
ncbi:hypothetical protein Tco_1147903 [Tanacetum coccineum]